MKFSCFFAALASAADNQAPVISLNLVGANYVNNGGVLKAYAHGQTKGTVNADHQNNFADECEVYANTLIACEEPTATVYDHHDEGVVVSTVYEMVHSTSAGVWAPEADSDIETVNGITLGNGASRGEWVIIYSAEDASGNTADTLSFALMLMDTDGPHCGESGGDGAGTVGCDFMTGNPMSFAQLYFIPTTSTCTAFSDKPGMYGCTSELELCNDIESDEWGIVTNFQIMADSDLQFVDDYDGTMQGVMDIFETNNGVRGAKLPFPDHTIASSYIKSRSMSFDIQYHIYVNDFADLFGSDNVNNQYEEEGTLTLTDDMNPEIVEIFNPDEASYIVQECGYIHTTGTFEPSYKDCYDDFSEAWNDVDSHVEYVGSDDIVSTLADFEGVQIVTEDFKIVSNVSDMFGNEAPEVVFQVTVTDTLAPTIYLTHHDIRLKNSDEAHNCDGELKAQTIYNVVDKAPEDFSNEYCDDVEYGSSSLNSNLNTHRFDMKATPDLGQSEFDDFDAIIIYHSAGVSAGYTYITDLTMEGKGFECFDACGPTTTVVNWVTDCTAETVGGEFDLKEVGTYMLHYTCSDSEGLEAKGCRTFINVDSTKPVITCLLCANDNDGNLYLEADPTAVYEDSGASCSDVVDGELGAEAVIVSGDTVDYATPGTYTISYNCDDSAGNSAVSNSRWVVIEDTQCPTCEFQNNGVGLEEVSMEASFPYNDQEGKWEVTCSDSLDGELDVISEGEVDVELTGDYVLTYHAEDEAGNTFKGVNSDGDAFGNKCEGDDHQIYRTVHVKDTIEPTIHLTYDGEELTASRRDDEPATNPYMPLSTTMDGNGDAFPANTYANLMAESNVSVNGWVIGAVASAVSGVALLGYAATRKGSVATSVPV